MIDVKEPLRTAYFQALDGQLFYDGKPVPIGDEMAPFGDDVSLYVIIAGQSDGQENTFQSWGSFEELNLDIINKTTARNSKEPLDNVAGQILAILFPDPANKGVSGLPAQPGIQINSPVLSSNRYIPLSLNSSNSVLRRIMTFKQHILQTQ